MSSFGDPFSQTTRLHVGLVLKQRGWILEKMAQSLSENLEEWGITAELVPTPSPTADINHWMIYNDVQDKFIGRSTLAITHVDRPLKFHVLKKRLEKADLGICMSRMTIEQLVFSGIPRQKLCFVLPGHDGDIQPKRIVVGLTTMIRTDGAKRENLLIKTAQSIRLDAFHFSIVGPGWEKIIPILESSGATVDYSPGATNNEDHRRILLQKLPTFDYYLYMGWDEGSMGLLDALAAGLPTIVTPQGFHLDINGAITHPIWDASDLCSAFKKISQERRQRMESVARLTWREYARGHALIWRGLYSNNLSQALQGFHSAEVNQLSINESLQEAKRHRLFPYPQKYNPASLLSDIYLLMNFYTGGWFGRSFLYRFLTFIRNRYHSHKK